MHNHICCSKKIEGTHGHHSVTPSQSHFLHISLSSQEATVTENQVDQLLRKIGKTTSGVRRQLGRQPI